MSHQINYSNCKLFYYKSGIGQKHILLFHGFGQEHSVFDSWIDVLKSNYTVYTFDLFFHGESVWNENHPLEKDDWKKILSIFFEKENINEFEVGGFSLGGKFALATLEAFPNQIKKIILAAPDGIKVNFWYGLATYPVLMRGIFEMIISKPQLFFSLAKFLQSIRIIDKYLLRFVMLQMDTEQKRKQVYAVWILFRSLKFEMKEIAQLIDERKIELKIYVGKFDRVIPVKEMNRLLKYVPDGKLKIIDAGHNNLIEKINLLED